MNSYYKGFFVMKLMKRKLFSNFALWIVVICSNIIIVEL